MIFASSIIVLTSIYRGGSHNMGLAHIWLDTKRDIVMVIATKISGTRANEALLDTAAKLHQK